MLYFREFWADTRRILFEHIDLVVITVVAMLVLTVPHHHYFDLRGVGGELRSALRIASRGLAFLILPLLSLLILRLPLKEFGFSWGEPKKWLRDVALFYIIMLPLLFFVARQPDFKSTYPYFSMAKLGMGYYLLSQGFQLVFMFGWEFLCRGYLLFGFHRKIGNAAVLVQTIPFVLMHLGKPELETYGSIIAGLALGIVALRARSFLPCVLIHFSVAATLDLLSVL